MPSCTSASASWKPGSARTLPIHGVHLRRTHRKYPQSRMRRTPGGNAVANPVVTLLSGRYRLSRREVRQLLQDPWAVRVPLGAMVRQEQVQSAALAPVVDEAQTVVQQAHAVNLDETGWRQERRRAWLWTAVTAELTVFRIDRRRGGLPGSGGRGGAAGNRRALAAAGGPGGPERLPLSLSRPDLARRSVPLTVGADKCQFRDRHPDLHGVYWAPGITRRWGTFRRTR